MRNPLNVTQIQLHQLGTSAMAPTQTDTLIGVHAGQTSLQYPLSQIAAAVREAGNANVVTPQQFGCKGDGTPENIANFNLFLANVSGKTAELYGTYNLPSLPTVMAISNCNWIGVLGNATITGAYGYIMLQFAGLNNVSFQNIKFENTYSNAVFNGVGSVYVFEQDVKNVSFLNCEFTTPNASTSGLALIARFTGTTAVIQGLWIENCYFHDIGSNGCTIMNRGFSQGDKYTACSQIYFNNNRCASMGLLGGGLSNLVSLDGVGSAFTANYNKISGCSYFGIENTGFINGTIIGNTALDGSGVFNCEGTDAVNGNRIMTGLTCIGNVETAAKTDANFLYFVENSFFANNQFRSATRGMQMHGIQNCTFVGEEYIMTDVAGDFAILMEGGTGSPSNGNSCTNNRFYGCEFDNSAATSTITMLFDATNAAISGNIFDAMCRITGSGGTPILFAEINGATANWFNGLPTQAVTIYNAYTNDNNYEAGSLDWQSNVLTVETSAGSGGGTVRGYQVRTGGNRRLDYGVTRASGWSFFASGDLVQSNGAFFMNAAGVPAFILTSVGTNFGLIENVDAHTWNLGWGASGTSNGTAAITWTDNGKITLNPVSGGVDVVTTLQVGSGTTDQATITGGAAGASYGSSAGTLSFKPAGTLRLDYGVTRASGWNFSAAGDLIQSNAAYYVSAQGVPAFIMNSAGANFAQIANANATSWFLGYGSSGLTNDTAVISWGDTPSIGFYGTSPIAKPTVTGSKGANAALTSLMTALSNLGLVTDSTS